MPAPYLPQWPSGSAAGFFIVLQGQRAFGGFFEKTQLFFFSASSVVQLRAQGRLFLLPNSFRCRSESRFSTVLAKLFNDVAGWSPRWLVPGACWGALSAGRHPSNAPFSGSALLVSALRLVSILRPILRPAAGWYQKTSEEVVMTVIPDLVSSLPCCLRSGHHSHF